MVEETIELQVNRGAGSRATRSTQLQALGIVAKTQGVVDESSTCKQQQRVELQLISCIRRVVSVQAHALMLNQSVRMTLSNVQFSILQTPSSTT